MSDFELGPSGDWVVRNGQIPLLRGKDAIAQSLLTRLRTIKGEWQQDRRVGVPYYESILTDRFDEQVARSVFSKVITETPGIAQLVSLYFDADTVNRLLYISCEALTVDDETIVLTHQELIV